MISPQAQKELKLPSLPRATLKHHHPTDPLHIQLQKIQETCIFIAYYLKESVRLRRQNAITKSDSIQKVAHASPLRVELEQRMDIHIYAVRNHFADRPHPLMYTALLNAIVKPRFHEEIYA